jgi:hypothetical protein
MSRGSKQAIHRRLAALGDEAYEEAGHTAPMPWFVEDLGEMRSIVEAWASRTTRTELSRQVSRTVMALSRVRKVPLWWRGKFWYRRD